MTKFTFLCFFTNKYFFHIKTKLMVSKNRQHFYFKNFLIRCILDYAQRHLVDFWKKRPANFDFIWLEWNSYNSSIQIHIVWSRSSIFKLKTSPAQGWPFYGYFFISHFQSIRFPHLLEGLIYPYKLEWTKGGWFFNV